MTLTRTITTLALSSALAACSTPQIDNTPKHLTSVVKVKSTINGLYFPDNKGTQTVYTRENMRAIDQSAEFDSFYMRWANYDKTNIFRMGDNLLLEINHNKESYRECPLNGCTDAFAKLMEKSQSTSDDEEEYETYEEKGCNVTLDKNDFDVIATNKTRTISGLQAKEYKASWTTEFKDMQGRVDQNLVQFVFWTTTPTAEMQSAWKVYQKATDNYLNTVGDNNPLVRVLGKDGYKAISAFSGDVEKTDTTQFNKITQKIATIQGYPLSIKLEWFQKNEACPAPKNKRANEEIDLSKGIGSAASTFFGNIIKDGADKVVDSVADDWKKEARVRYIYEVTSVSEEMINDSAFEVPKDYTLEDRQ
jgi:hypothetical protein